MDADGGNLTVLKKDYPLPRVLPEQIRSRPIGFCVFSAIEALMRDLVFLGSCKIVVLDSTVLTIAFNENLQNVDSVVFGVFRNTFL